MERERCGRRRHAGIPNQSDNSTRTQVFPVPVLFLNKHPMWARAEVLYNCHVLGEIVIVKIARNKKLVVKTLTNLTDNAK